MKNYCRNSILILFFLIAEENIFSQEIKARVICNASLIPSTVERDIFTSLQNDLEQFINNKKWTDKNYEEHEKIECNFYVNLFEQNEENVYSASLVIQAKRPVFGTDYFSPLINQTDQDFTFKYVKNQFVEFNEFRIQGTNPLASNLTAVIAFYIYLILGIDADTYSLKAGANFYEKAFFIVNNAPEQIGDIEGWQARESRTNRYWIVENFFSSNYNIMHDVYYEYYRKGLDILPESPDIAKNNIVFALQKAKNIYLSYPGSVIASIFLQPRTTEIINIFATADEKKKQVVANILSTIDISNKNMIKQKLGY